MLRISGNGSPEYEVKRDVAYDAGPPVDSAAPLVTNKPVPGKGVSTLCNNPILREVSRRTDGASDCDHLQMAAL
jgi:hypothetical protein